MTCFPLATAKAKKSPAKPGMVNYTQILPFIPGKLRMTSSRRDFS
jgi:hypothetical protein